MEVRGTLVSLFIPAYEDLCGDDIVDQLSQNVVLVEEKSVKLSVQNDE